jgi:hypothetical protein
MQVFLVLWETSIGCVPLTDNGGREKADVPRGFRRVVCRCSLLTRHGIRDFDWRILGNTTPEINLDKPRGNTETNRKDNWTAP